MTKDKIIAALPSLSQPDLLAIKAVTVDLLQQGQGGVPVGTSDPQAWLFVAIQRVLGNGYVASNSLKNLPQNSVAFLDFTSKHFNSVLENKTAAIAVMSELVRLVASDLKDKQVPVTYKTIVDNLPRIADIFEHAFPGYVASNMAGLFMVGMKTAS